MNHSSVLVPSSAAPRLSIPTRMGVLFLGVLSVVMLGVPALHGQAPAPRTPVSTRVFAASEDAQDNGPLPDSQRVSLTLTLAPTADRTAALGQYLTALNTVGSPNYHQWLTPATFRSQFGASADQLQAASAWAQAQGFSVDATSLSGMRLSVSGSASQVQAAFETTLHGVAAGGRQYHANLSPASLSPDAAALIAAVDGLDDVPSAATLSAPGATGFSALASLVDANAAGSLGIASSACLDTLAATEVAEYSALLDQAAAQGISVVSASACGMGAFPSALSQVTAVALAGSTTPDTGAALEARPAWQVAPGLPADALRHAPDLTVASLAAFTLAMDQIAGSGRLGNLNPTLYLLATTPGLFTQSDGAPAGTWEQGSGLGAVSLDKLIKVYPRGAGSSFTSFQATNYAPDHGQPTSFTSSVTSGTGGATPTGTVAFVTSSGTTLGTAPLVGGTASFTINTLDGGTYIIGAVYSGDATYASSNSPTSQLYVGPEPSRLAVVIGGNPVIGGTYTVTVTDTAPSGVGTPAGAVTVTLSATGANYTATLAPTVAGSSAATVSIPASPAGTLTLAVNCTPSANYGCSNPYATTVTIAKATPTLSISYQPNPPVSGATIALNAAVSTVGSAPAPTGSVTFYDNGTVLNASGLTNGSTSTTGVVPTTGTHSITATYAGDSNYLSVSTTATSTSSGTITTGTSLRASTATVTAGQSITFTATIAPSSTGPANLTGTVQFFDNGALTGTANVSANQATFAISTLSPAVTHSITAAYSGDGYYGNSTSAPVVLARSNAGIATSTTLSASANTITAGQSIAFTATIAPATTGSANPTGSVTFFDGSTMVGSASVAGNVASFATAALAANTSHSITAGYAGDGLYAASTSQPVVINKSASTIATTTAVLASAATVTAGQSITFTATVSPATVSPNGAATGNVFFYDGTTLLGSAALAGNTAAFATSSLSATASHSVTAVYAGDSNYTGSTSAAAIVNRGTGATPTTTILSVSVATSTFGAPVTFSASVTPAAATGTVQFVTGSTTLCAATLTAGTATCPAATLPQGTDSITANYLGDSIYSAGVSAPAQVVVSPASGASNATLTVLVSPAIAQPGATATVTVNVASPTATLLTGNLTATVNGVAYPSALSGTASSYALAIPVVVPATPGVYTVVVACSGGNLTCTPVSATLTSSSTASTLIATTTTLTAAAATTPAGSYTLTATIAPASTGASAPTGTVIFYDNTTPIATASVTANAASVTANSATVTTPLSSSAPHVLTAVYSGDVRYASSISTAVTPGTTLGTTTATLIPAVSLSANGTSVLAGSNVVLTATVAGITAKGQAPTGTVTFYATGATPLVIGTATLGTTGSGVATAVLSTTGIPGGTRSVYAVYNGDTSFTKATSNTVNFGVSTFSLTFVPATLTLTAGSSGQATAVYTAINNFAGTLILGCTPPPDTLMTCSFAAATLTASGTTVLTVNTTAPRSQAVESTRRAGLTGLRALGGISLAACFCWLLPARRRRLPGMVVVLLALALTANLGCSDGTFGTPAALTGGSPLGTTLLTITAAATDGVNTVRRTDTFQVTVQ